MQAKLQSLKLGPRGFRNINEYVLRFRYLEARIHKMAFKDRLHFFTNPFPLIWRLTSATKCSTIWKIYEAERQRASWRVNRRVGNSSNSSTSQLHSKLKTKPLYRSFRTDLRKIADSDNEDDMDILDAKELAGIHCYNCRKLGHFSNNCKKERTFKPNRNFKAKAKAFYQTEEASGSSELLFDEQSEMEELDPDNVTMMSLYELMDAGQSIIALSSSKFPRLFNAKLNDSH